MKYHTRLLTPLALAAALCLGGGAQAATVTGSATSASVTQGGTALVTVSLDFSEAVSLIGLTFAATWETGVVSSTAAGVSVLGHSLSELDAMFPGGFNEIGVDDHHVGVSVITLDPPPISLPAGASTITFSLTGLALGVHDVHYSFSVTDAGFNDVASADFTSTVAVSAVPEPSPAVLLAAGVAVLGLLARRKIR